MKNIQFPIFLYKEYNDELAYGEEFTRLFIDKGVAGSLLKEHVQNTYKMPLEEMRNDPEFVEDSLLDDYVSIRNDGGDCSFFIVEEKGLSLSEEEARRLGTMLLDMADLQHKKNYVLDQVGANICNDLPDAFFVHTYRAIKEYGMSLYDADKWAWLNTLFGYDIGADHARVLIEWFYKNGMDVMELTAESLDTIRHVSEDLGLFFDYSRFAKTTPDMISYVC